MAYSRLVQVSNLSAHCTKDQLTTLFSYVGPLEESVIYPEGETLTSTVGTKVGYIRFTRSESARIAIHLTNIIFVEKQLIVAYVLDGRIPDEADAIKYCAPLNPNITLIAGGPTWNSTIINRVVGQGVNAEIETMDHELNERHLPPYPNLSGSLDHCKAEEIRRTVYISNIDRSITPAMLEEFISQIGEVRFIRAAYDNDDNDTRDTYVEFAEQHSVPRALCLNGFVLLDRPIEVNHATLGISKAISLTAPLPEILEDIAEPRKSRSPSRHKHSATPERKRSLRSSSRHRSRSDSCDRKRRSHRRERSPSYLRQRSPSYHRRASSRYYYYGSNRPRSPPPGYYSDRYYGNRSGRRHGFPMPPVYHHDRSPSPNDRYTSSRRGRRYSPPSRRSRSPLKKSSRHRRSRSIEDRERRRRRSRSRADSISKGQSRVTRSRSPIDTKKKERSYTSKEKEKRSSRKSPQNKTSRRSRSKSSKRLSVERSDRKSSITRREDNRSAERSNKLSAESRRDKVKSERGENDLSPNPRRRRTKRDESTSANEDNIIEVRKSKDSNLLRVNDDRDDRKRIRAESKKSIERTSEKTRSRERTNNENQSNGYISSESPKRSKDCSSRKQRRRRKHSRSTESPLDRNGPTITKDTNRRGSISRKDKSPRRISSKKQQSSRRSRSVSYSD